MRFRWSRAVPDDVKSFRVTRDRAGRWHVAFAHVPDPVDGPRTGTVVGIDRGVTISAALSTGEKLQVPGLTAKGEGPPAAAGTEARPGPPRVQTPREGQNEYRETEGP